MTRDEAKRIVMIIKTAYPNYRPDDLTAAVNAWATILKDYDYNDVVTGLTAYITTDTTGFPPSMGQVIAKIHVVDEYTGLNEMEAWALVSKALRNGYYGAEKEFSALPPLVQKAVGTPDNLRNWATSDVESVENVIQSNFMRTYRTVIKRENEYKRLPENVRIAIKDAGKILLEGGAGDV